jgi:ornithine cyclodeaminase/alanine dehydrogenase-like protein (mu-crystallin family)
MKIFDTATTREALDFATLIPSLKKGFIDGCHVPLRHAHTIETGDGGAGTVLIMPAWRTGGYLGIKTVNIFAGNAARGLPGLHSTYVLYDARTGEPLAQMDGNEITSRRTAAASALAASYLARDDASHMVLLGAGRVASLVPAAYRSQLPITEVEVWDIDPESAARLVRQLQREGFAASVVVDLPASVARADVVSCATLATAPIVNAR